MSGNRRASDAFATENQDADGGEYGQRRAEENHGPGGSMRAEGRMVFDRRNWTRVVVVLLVGIDNDGAILPARRRRRRQIGRDFLRML